MKTTLAGFCIIVSLLVAGPVLADKTIKYRALAIDVIDGNTIVVSNKSFYGGVQLAGVSRVALDAVRAPEFDQPGGLDAREYLSKLVKGQDVLVIERLDMGSSRGAWVFLGPENRCVNALLIDDGKAWLTEPRVQSVVSDGEAKEVYKKMKESFLTAKERKVGIWSSTNAVPPWDWVKDRKQKAATNAVPVVP